VGEGEGDSRTCGNELEGLSLSLFVGHGCCRCGGFGDEWRSGVLVVGLREMD
jgi:hypothetical protein